MSFIDTTLLLEAVKGTLEALALKPEADPKGTKLFELVAFYNLREPDQALQQLFATGEQRVAFIVAGGDEHTTAGGRDRVSVTAHCDVDFEIMMSDRVWEKTDPAAVLGGPDNIGVLRMKDRTRTALLGQTLGLPGVALLTRSGGLMDLFDPRGNNQGRTFWSQQWGTYVGREIVAVE